MQSDVGIDRSFRAKIRTFSDMSIPALTKIMGILLILYGLLYIYMYFLKNDGTEPPWTIIAATTVILVCGYLIIIDFGFSFGRMLGLYAIALGGSRAFKYLNYIKWSTDSSVFATVVFIGTIVMLIAALNLCYTGYVYLRGNMRGRKGMYISALVMIALMCALIGVSAYFQKLSLYEIIMGYPKETVTIILYVLLLWMLSSQRIREFDKSERYVSVLNGIRRTEASVSKSYIYRSVAADLCKAFEDRSSWVKIDDEGPVEAEYHFKLNNRNDDHSCVIVQKWKGRDDIFFTITGYEYGSVMDAYRFVCKKIVPEGSIEDCARIHLYGDDSHLQILVKNDPYNTWWGVGSD